MTAYERAASRFRPSVTGRCLSQGMQQSRGQQGGTSGRGAGIFQAQAHPSISSISLPRETGMQADVRIVEANQWYTGGRTSPPYQGGRDLFFDDLFEFAPQNIVGTWTLFDGITTAKMSFLQFYYHLLLHTMHPEQTVENLRDIALKVNRVSELRRRTIVLANSHIKRPDYGSFPIETYRDLADQIPKVLNTQPEFSNLIRHFKSFPEGVSAIYCSHDAILGSGMDLAETVLFLDRRTTISPTDGEQVLGNILSSLSV